MSVCALGEMVLLLMVGKLVGFVSILWQESAFF